MSPDEIWTCCVDPDHDDGHGHGPCRESVRDSSDVAVVSGSGLQARNNRPRAAPHGSETFPCDGSVNEFGAGLCCGHGGLSAHHGSRVYRDPDRRVLVLIDCAPVSLSDCVRSDQQPSHHENDCAHGDHLLLYENESYPVSVWKSGFFHAYHGPLSDSYRDEASETDHRVFCYRRVFCGPHRVVDFVPSSSPCPGFSTHCDLIVYHPEDLTADCHVEFVNHAWPIDF